MAKSLEEIKEILGKIDPTYFDSKDQEGRTVNGKRSTSLEEFTRYITLSNKAPRNEKVFKVLTHIILNDLDNIKNPDSRNEYVKIISDATEGHGRFKEIQDLTDRKIRDLDPKSVPAPEKPRSAPAPEKPRSAPAPEKPRSAPAPKKPRSAPAPEKPKEDDWIRRAAQKTADRAEAARTKSQAERATAQSHSGFKKPLTRAERMRPKVQSH